MDAVFDSVSVATTFRATLQKAGVIFCPISEAVRDYPELVQQYLGSVVPVSDNFFAALNSAVFTDGSFVYVPKGVRCPMELSTYFRIGARPDRTGFPSPQVRPTRQRPCAKTISTPEWTLRRLCADSRRRQHCREHDELRNFLRSRSRHNQHVPATRRLRHARIAMRVMQAA